MSDERLEKCLAMLWSEGDYDPSEDMIRDPVCREASEVLFEQAAEITRLRTENAALRERCRVLEKAMRPAVVLMWERIEAIEKNTGKTMDYLRQVAVGCDKALAGATDAADAMEES